MGLGKHAQQSSSPEEKPGEPGAAERGKKKGVIVLVVLLVLLLCGGAAGVGFIVWQQVAMDKAATQQQASQPEPVVIEEDERPENPVDFASLKQQNPDIYAWVSIPGTDVNVPILQSVVDDNYYLDHDVDGNYSIAGAAYTQRANATDFSDPVTVVYGHQVENGSMFTTLHYFENADFFAEHDEMYVYTVGRILTYKIVAAYQYDDRHILNSFDFSDPAVVRKYFDSVLNPTSMLVNVREGVVLDADDKIVQLSTCMDPVMRDATRYIVTGVLVDEQETK